VANGRAHSWVKASSRPSPFGWMPASACPGGAAWTTGCRVTLGAIAASRSPSRGQKARRLLLAAQGLESLAWRAQMRAAMGLRPLQGVSSTSLQGRANVAVEAQIKRALRLPLQGHRIAAGGEQNNSGWCRRPSRGQALEIWVAWVGSADCRHAAAGAQGARRVPTAGVQTQPCSSAQGRARAALQRRRSQTPLRVLGGSRKFLQGGPSLPNHLAGVRRPHRCGLAESPGQTFAVTAAGSGRSPAPWLERLRRSTERRAEGDEVDQIARTAITHRAGGCRSTGRAIVNEDIDHTGTYHGADADHPQ